jgi:SAM-dependent methyltransferase
MSTRPPPRPFAASARASPSAASSASRPTKRDAPAFPAVTGTGYDAYPPVIEQARQAAAEAGVADRVTYQVRDAAAGLPEAFDVITTFDVVHDSADPLGLLRSIRDALRPGGRYLCLEINCADQPAGNVGPIASLLYGFSLLYCMTTSLAQDGEGLGTLGLPESRLHQLAGKAGFGQIRRVEMDNPFNTLYELTR